MRSIGVRIRVEIGYTYLEHDIIKYYLSSTFLVEYCVKRMLGNSRKQYKFNKQYVFSKIEYVLGMFHSDNLHMSDIILHKN